MSPLRDYVAWHEAYDDPDSPLSWRLATVREAIRTDLVTRAAAEPDRRLRVASACSGDGRDVLGVLAEPGAPSDVDVTLLEVHPVLAARARESAAALPAGVRVEVREQDAGLTASWAGAVPADLVLLVGVLGNVDDADLVRVAHTVPRLAAAGATVVWTHGGAPGGRGEVMRRELTRVGCTETSYRWLDREHRPSVGVVRFDGEPRPLDPGDRVFTMRR